MFGKKKKAPMPKGQGAAAAKQMGLFVDLNPEEMMMGAEETLDDPDLEAELAAITGNKAAARGKAKPKGKSPLPMEDIAKMADECMRDVDEDDDDNNIEDDEDLLAELQEVVGDEEVGDAATPSSTSSASAQSSQVETVEPPTAPKVKVSKAAPGSLQHTLEERAEMYKTAMKNAKSAGETLKARRYDRGLKTLESMIAAVEKGNPVNESEIPPPVATGAPTATSRPAVPSRPAPPVPSCPEGETETTTLPMASFDAVTPSSEEEQSSSTSAPTLRDLPSPDETPAKLSKLRPTDSVNEATKAMLLERQKEYKLAALRAKKEGDMEQAKLYFRTSKNFDAVIEALEKGQAVDLSGLPSLPGKGAGGISAAVSKPSPEQNLQASQTVTAASGPAGPSAPKDVLEALEQRRVKYVEASNQAKASGDDRKARMHDRIAKQYQSAIRAHKAGKPVNFEELPVPPGFPPIPGQKVAGDDQGLVATLEAASKLASTNVEDDDEKEEESKVGVLEKLKEPALDVPSAGPERKRSPSASPDRKSPEENLSPAAAQLLELLDSRKKQFMKAALQAKQKDDMEQAKVFLRTAKSLDPMIKAARSGKTVDINTLPSPPGDEEDDFILVHHSDVQVSEKAGPVYTQLSNILKEQHEKCLTYSKQFTHLGNVSETTKFEKMAESCKKSLDVLKLAQSRGLPPPPHHFEEKSFRTVRIFPELSSTDMVVIIVKGMNLPAPSGIQPNDLDAYVKFEFPYPTAEQPQRHKTNVIKNTNSPEYNQSFTLSINRNHRGFRRVVASKGLKLELLHKGRSMASELNFKVVSKGFANFSTRCNKRCREILADIDTQHDKVAANRLAANPRCQSPFSTKSQGKSD